MRSSFFVTNMYLQNDIYDILKTTGRLGAIIVIPLDTAVEIIKFPLQAMQDLVSVILNVLGCLFSDYYTLKDALKNAETSLLHLLHTPVAIVMAVPKAAYQFCAIMIDPVNVRPFYDARTFYKPAPLFPDYYE